MPFYELCLLVRVMPKEQTLSCLKRAANSIWQANGVITKIDFLGEKNMPMKRVAKDDDQIRHSNANYFIYHTSLGNDKPKTLMAEIDRDADLVQTRLNLVAKQYLPPDYECTLEEELQIPSKRKSVRPLLDEKNVRAEPRHIGPT